MNETFLTAEEAWGELQEYRTRYYNRNIAAYNGRKDDLSRTADTETFWKRSGKCKIHVPLAADIASTSAKLLFAEEPTFSSKDIDTEENERTPQRRLDELIAKNNLHGKLNEGAESCAALGDVYLKLNWWKDEIDYPVLTVVQGDSAWPEFLFGVLRCIHFFSVVKRTETEVLRIYERYEQGKITMALYSGTPSDLGARQPVSALRKYGFTSAEITPPIDEMLAVHIPNMRPNRHFRDTSMGRSDFDGLRPLMDSLDETYSSWMRDVRLAKARLIVPVDYLKRKPKDMLDDAVKYEFDEDVETLVALDINTDNGGSITPSQFAIRAAEHSATCEELIREIVSIAGYAPQTFGLDISGLAQSGTALHIREKKSYDTRGLKQTYWQAPLEQIMTALVHLDNALFPEAGSENDDEVKIRFADSSANDISTLAGALSMLASANAISDEMKIEMLHPDWTQKQKDDELKRLRSAAAMAAVGDALGGMMTQQETTGE